MNETGLKNTTSNMTEPQKAYKRKGILIADAEALAYGKFGKVKALFDTGASRPVVGRNSNLLLIGAPKRRALKKLYFTEDAELYDAVKHEKTATIKTVHGKKVLQPEDLGVICIKINGHQIYSVAIKTAPESLPHGTEIIIDADTLRISKTDVNRLLAQQGVEENVPRDDKGATPPQGKSTPDPPKIWQAYVETKRTEYRTSDESETFMSIFAYSTELTDEIYLSEIKCKKILTENPDIFKPKEYNANMIDITENVEECSKAEQKLLRQLTEAYTDIFAGKDTLPKPMKDQPPAQFLTRDSAEPSRCAKPRWGPSQEQLLLKWARASLASGLIEPAGDNCPYANRPHVVEKPNNGARVTGDFVKLNETIPKRPGNLPNMEDELRKHRGAKYFTLADAAQGYYQLKLDAESRQRCALWTPLGLMVPTRLWMGPKNAGTIYQTAVTTALGTMPEATQKKTSNYMDDFLVSGTDFKKYYENTRNFFQMCRERGITLNPAKTKLGYKSAKLLGREVSGDKVYVHGDNLKALRDCRRPTNVPEVKSFLGICAYARKHVKDFAFHAECLYNLTRKGVPWAWPKQTHDQFVALKEKVLANFKLHVPDADKPFYLFTDASDLGMGAHLCQLKNPVKDSELHTVKDEDKLTIAFYSASFDLAMQQKPVYYREARAMIWGLEKAKEFLVRSAHETVVVTDHAPLQWIKSTNKGAVSAWLIESVADPDYRVVYMPGKSNTTADALSRPPLVSPSKLTLLGAAEAWDAMLKLLPERHMHSAKVHVWAAQHTALVQRKVQAWRVLGNAINVRAPKSMLNHSKDFDLIMSAPAAEEAPVVAHQIVRQLIETKSDATFACLVPTELISYIPSKGGDPRSEPEIREEIKRRIEQEATKIAFAQTGFTWLIFDKQEKSFDKIITNFMNVCNIETDKTVTKSAIQKDTLEVYPIWAAADEETTEKQNCFTDTAVYGNIAKSDLGSWIAEQKTDSAILEKNYKGKTLTREDGLILIATDEGNKVYVPQTKRETLIINTHRQMAHGMTQRVKRVLTNKYVWPKMTSDILSELAKCSECPLAKAKKNIKHNLYSITEYRKPRSAYGVDYYSIAK